MSVFRWVAALVALLIALAAALLAQDVRSWRDTLHDDYLRFAVTPDGPEQWTASTVLPAGLSERLLAVERDRQWLSALRFYVIAHALAQGVEPQYITPAHQRLINTASASLSVASQTSDPARASQAYDLLALLLLTQVKSVTGQLDVAAADAVVANLQNAVRVDDGNDHAKVNLELALRALVRTPASEKLVGGNQASGKRKGASPTPTGAGY
jgi:hypothetical protein